MNQKMSIPKRIIGTFALPAGMFLVMMAFCYANGKMYFGTLMMWRTLIVNIAVVSICAMGIGLQFDNGRFDFSGGAVMLLSAIVGGNIAKNAGNNVVLFAILCIVLCVGLSVLAAALYVFGRLPIAVSSIAMALLFESITPLIYNGAGINFIATIEMKKLSTFPGVMIPFVIAFAVYFFYNRFTVTGKQSILLAKNQNAAVNIGINERKNILVSYAFSGLIFGCGTMVWTSMTIKSASFTSLSTVGDLFMNILPVFIGLALAKYCGEEIGIIMGSVTLGLMTYGLQAVLSAEVGSALSMVFMGLFIFIFNIITTPMGSVITPLIDHWKKNRELNKGNAM